jgi:hypothetical protein
MPRRKEAVDAWIESRRFFWGIVRFGWIGV